MTVNPVSQSPVPVHEVELNLALSGDKLGVTIASELKGNADGNAGRSWLATSIKHAAGNIGGLSPDQARSAKSDVTRALFPRGVKENMVKFVAELGPSSDWRVRLR